MSLIRPIALATTALLTACAGKDIKEEATRYPDTAVSEFVNQKISYNKTAYNRPVFEAYFTGANPADLYVPVARLKIFCQAKGGTWENDPSSSVPSAFDLEMQTIMRRETTKIIQEHKSAFQAALTKGAIGSFRCTRQVTTVWSARIESANYSIATGIGTSSVLQLLISTKIGGGA
jgi:hypothetical protein